MRSCFLLRESVKVIETNNINYFWLTTNKQNAISYFRSDLFFINKNYQIQQLIFIIFWKLKMYLNFLILDFFQVFIAFSYFLIYFSIKFFLYHLDYLF